MLTLSLYPVFLLGVEGTVMVGGSPSREDVIHSTAGGTGKMDGKYLILWEGEEEQWVGGKHKGRN